MFIWENRDHRILVTGVLDGHGREVGRVAAQTGRAALQLYFDQNFLQLRTEPVQCLQNAFLTAHAAIKQAFALHYQGLGWEVIQAEDGFLMKRKVPSQNWSCIHGGSSCSIVALVGNKLFSANVGDSSVTLCTGVAGRLEESVTDIFDCAIVALNEGRAGHPSGSSLPLPLENNLDSVTGCLTTPGDKSARSSTLIVTAEHSPECANEFYRLRRFRTRETDPLQPSLFVVYDAPSMDKIICPPVFFVESNGTATVTNRGRFL
jgi:hypothetical protein